MTQEAAQGMITTVAVAECGCAVEAGAAGFSIRQCPVHASAPDAIDLLRRLVAEVEQATRLFGGHTGAPGDAVTGIEIEQRAYMLDALRARVAPARALLAALEGTTGPTTETED